MVLGTSRVAALSTAKGGAAKPTEREKMTALTDVEDIVRERDDARANNTALETDTARLRALNAELVAALEACMADTLYYAEQICEEGAHGRREGWQRIEAAKAALARVKEQT